MARILFSTVFDPKYSILAGSHRVQRVPDTEKRGRRHSSVITVACLDNSVKKKQVNIRQEDLRIDTYRDRGAGGQHRNKTDSAVRITHTPTGVVVTATEDRSQHNNRKVAMSRLEAELSRHYNDDFHQAVNNSRVDDINEFRTWTWTGWRDEVVSPHGKASMKKVLSGKMDALLNKNKR